MSDASITYLPVGNGDTSLITLSDRTTIIIDCNITQASQDDEDVTRFDVHSYLLKRLEEKDNIRFVDAFILTHPDQDHCRGFDKTFYVGDPGEYGEAHRKDGLILVSELWLSPGIFSKYDDELSDDAKAFQKEAERRIELYKANSPEKDEPGNRLRIIGYSNNSELEDLDEIITGAGQYVNLINGSLKEDFSFFVHAPFQRDSNAADSERNRISVVLHASFDVDGEERAGLAVLGGDAVCDTWAQILDQSDDENLQWDLFLSPHHCSWTFFSDEPYKDNKIPSEKSLELLEKKRQGAIVVASCKPIKDDDDNPPHHAAKKLYIEAVDEEKFYVTMEHPEENQPLPLKFEISKNGPVKIEDSESSAIASSASVQSAVGAPQTYGK